MYGKMFKNVLLICSISMKKLTVIIDNKLDSNFRETVAKNIGYRKGNLQVAIREAINN